MPASLSVNDQKLIDAKAGMIAADEAIDQLYSKFGDMPELAALDAERNGHIETLIKVRSTSAAGLQAKANALLERRCFEDNDALPRIAVSQARDVARPRLQEPVEDVYRLASNSGEDADVIEAGRKLEALIPGYAEEWFEWAKLHRCGLQNIW
jgi:hypothetical protein